MKKNLLARPAVGENADFDLNVHLNVRPGRQSVRLTPLVVGENSRIRSGSVLYAATQIGDDFETGHNVVVREENRIGDHVAIWNNTTIDYGCVIGNRVKIHSNCYVAQYSVLEDDVFLAPGVIFANDLFPGSPVSAELLQGPVLRKGAKLGVNCTILPGVEIGAGAIIGSGSVVTHDVPAGAIVWGNPARVRKARKDARWPADYRILRREADRFYRQRVLGRPAYKKS